MRPSPHRYLVRTQRGRKQETAREAGDMLIHANAPVYLILATHGEGIARAAVAAMAFAPLGTLVPLRAIKHIDPAGVFRR